MRLFMLLVTSLLLPAWVNPAMAQGLGRSDIELDGKPPSELLQDWEGGQRVLFWSRQDHAWLELFRGDQITGILGDDRSYLKRIVSGGRQWQWRNTGYVPLIMEPAVLASSASDEDFDAAIKYLNPDLGAPLENSVANSTFQMSVGGRAPIRAVYLVNSVLCQNGGSVCPVVIFRDGRPISETLLSQEAEWGMGLRDELPVLEIQNPTSVTQVDLTSGEEFILPEFQPVIASGAPSRPRHLPAGEE